MWEGILSHIDDSQIQDTTPISAEKAAPGEYSAKENGVSATATNEGPAC